MKIRFTYIIFVLTCKPFNERGHLYHSDIQILRLLQQHILPSIPKNMRCGISLRSFEGFSVNILTSLVKPYPNIQLIQGNVFKEIADASFIIGFNSTVLEEAAILGKKVVILSDCDCMSLIGSSGKDTHLPLSDLPLLLNSIIASDTTNDVSNVDNYVLSFPNFVNPPLNLSELI